jgi:predicted CXXCH cytochrome family protein
VTLCASCHEENSLILGTDHDLRVTAAKEKNMANKTVKESGVCGSCHEVHKAWGNKLWGRSAGSGKNRIEALCKGCHEKRKAASKKQLQGPNHPMNKKVSDAKATLKRETSGFYKEGVDRHDIKTDLPLFTKDGERSFEGDITCATCHNPHIWDIKDKKRGAGENIEGDGSNSFLRKANNDKSSLCITCHTEKRYVYQSDHDMSVTAPGQKNGLKMTVQQSGVCSACHVPHGAPSGDYKLWARGLSRASDFLPEKTCLSCHSPGNAGKKKIVRNFVHPGSIVVSELTKPEDRNYAPLYDKKGNEAKTGRIACPSCHNPHLWETGQLKTGAGKNLEGTNRSSFLRLKSAKSVCKDCHGFDALIRYKYFHTKEVRTKGLGAPGMR